MKTKTFVPDVLPVHNTLLYRGPITVEMCINIAWHLLNKPERNHGVLKIPSVLECYKYKVTHKAPFIAPKWFIDEVMSAIRTPQIKLDRTSPIV